MRLKGSPKTGGRRKGSLNKKTVDLEKTIKRAQEAAVWLTPRQIAGMQPIDVLFMAFRFCLTDLNDILLAATFAEKAAPYVHAKLATTTVNANIRRSSTDFTDDELAAIAGEAGGEDGDREEARWPN
jgi:hypothetical protein